MQYRGKLIVFEGISGSGKSSLIEKVGLVLQESAYKVTFRKWNENGFYRQEKAIIPNYIQVLNGLGFCGVTYLELDRL